jgi:ribosome biogenesis protein YTM1
MDHQSSLAAQTQGQVRVTFTTTDDDLQLPESKRQLLVPVDIRRYGLSRILNSETMLATEVPIPFDFLVNGTFLQSTLEDYLKDHGLSLESHITLQYVRSLIPPVFQASFEHDDWVSAVDVLSATSPAGRWSGEGTGFQHGQDRILSASYDGLLRIWNASGQVLATSPSVSMGGHSASIKAAKFVTNAQVVSAGADRSVRVWKYIESNHFTGEFKPTLELYGHTASIDSVEVNGQNKRILTASADGAIGLWTASKKDAPEAPTSLLPTAHTTKRRKVSSSVSTPQRGPLSLMTIHKAPASAAIFDPRDRTIAYSASQDHTVKTLDLTTFREVTSLTTSHPLLSLCAVPRASTPLLAAGTSARHITLIDPRVSTATTSVMTLRGHSNMVVSLAACPDNDYSLVSGSHDGTCRIWDLRSSRPATQDEGLGSVSEPIYVIDRESRQGKKRPVAGEGCKVFGVTWDRLGIISAGEDKRVQINKGKDLSVGNE